MLHQMLVMLCLPNLALPQLNGRDSRSPSESMDDIIFEMPDIVTQYIYPEKFVTLEAFKVRNRTLTATPHWVSIGYPMLVKNANGKIFKFTSEYVTAHISVLHPSQKNALFLKAKRQYPNQNIQLDNILQLPLAEFSCSISFYSDDTRHEIRGSVYDLKIAPFALRFPLHKKSVKRAAFETRLQEVNEDPLILECELQATGKQEKTNLLKISSDQLEQFDLIDNLLGPANEKYVAREQLIQLSHRIKSNLRIEEHYELENEDFTEEFVQKMLENANARFQHVPIDQALSQLSKFSLSPDERDLAPNEIKRQYSDVLQVRIIGNRSQIIAKIDDHQSGSSRSGSSGGGSSGYMKIFSGSMKYANSKSSSWASDGSSLDDQLRDLNEHGQNSVKWEIQGTAIVPKSLNVARISRQSLTQQMTFSRIKKRIANAKYTRRYELSTSNVVDLNNASDRSENLIMPFGLEELQQLNSTLTTKIQALEESCQSSQRALNTAVSRIDSINAATGQTVENAKNALNSRIDSINAATNQAVENAKTALNSRIDSINTALMGEIERRTNTGAKLVGCRVCFQEIEGSSQCQGTRSSCSGWSHAGAGWTAPFRDDTDNRSGGCKYQWKVECVTQ